MSNEPKTKNQNKPKIRIFKEKFLGDETYEFEIDGEYYDGVSMHGNTSLNHEYSKRVYSYEVQTGFKNGNSKHKTFKVAGSYRDDWGHGSWSGAISQDGYETARKALKAAKDYAKKWIINDLKEKAAAQEPAAQEPAAQEPAAQDEIKTTIISGVFYSSLHLDLPKYIKDMDLNSYPTQLQTAVAAMKAEKNTIGFDAAGTADSDLINQILNIGDRPTIFDKYYRLKKNSWIDNKGFFRLADFLSNNDVTEVDIFLAKTVTNNFSDFIVDSVERKSNLLSPELNHNPKDIYFEKINGQYSATVETKSFSNFELFANNSSKFGFSFNYEIEIHGTDQKAVESYLKHCFDMRAKRLDPKFKAAKIVA